LIWEGKKTPSLWAKAFFAGKFFLTCQYLGLQTSAEQMPILAKILEKKKNNSASTFALSLHHNLFKSACHVKTDSLHLATFAFSLLHFTVCLREGRRDFSYFF
jgi:hypothetical protein